MIDVIHSYFLMGVEQTNLGRIMLWIALSAAVTVIYNTKTFPSYSSCFPSLCRYICTKDYIIQYIHINIYFLHQCNELIDNDILRFLDFLSLF